MSATPDLTPTEIDALIATMDEAADAYISGRARDYFRLIRQAEDFTLMPPYGGETRRYEPVTDEGIADTERYFPSGEATLQVEQTYASGELVVIVAVERQHGVLDGRPDQDLSLRVTLVFRRIADGWELAHRHADPLVRPISIDHLAALARGLDE
ncbi:nuclear transport factor 2 family protein [Microlunatus ginsengisoli]|uniref:SnoaL-like domain-containing protein n=1 Tax=Microlunatus ginsengisoli TaxID=363863 RepID=A0ABP7API2_9ACTN